MWSCNEIKTALTSQLCTCTVGLKIKSWQIQTKSVMKPHTPMFSCSVVRDYSLCSNMWTFLCLSMSRSVLNVAEDVLARGRRAAAVPGPELLTAVCVKQSVSGMSCMENKGWKSIWLNVENQMVMLTAQSGGFYCMEKHCDICNHGAVYAQSPSTPIMRSSACDKTY